MLSWTGRSYKLLRHDPPGTWRPQLISNHDVPDNLADHNNVHPMNIEPQVANPTPIIINAATTQP